MKTILVPLLMLAAAPAAAQTLPALTLAGADLGRVTADQVQGGLAVAIDLGGDTPQGSAVIARFQNGQPLMLAADGTWSPWSGDPDALADDGFAPDSGQLTFQILPPASALFWPAAFTLVIRTSGGVKSGTLVVDEAAP